MREPAVRAQTSIAADAEFGARDKGTLKTALKKSCTD
jgi:hypothetical protein